MLHISALMGCKRPLLAMTGACALSIPGTVSFVTWNGLYSSRILSSDSFRQASCTTRSSRHWRYLTIMNNDLGGASQRKKVVFLGTPDVAALSLEMLLKASRRGDGGGFDVVRVVSNPPAKVGRKKVLQSCPVQTLAESEGISVMTPTTARDETFLSEMEDLRPDLCITAAYGQFLPKRFLNIPRFGTLNVHPSLLPLYRGASPVQRCLEAGDSKTGVTVLFTELKMDSGPIVKQAVRMLHGSEKAPDLLRELFERGTGELVDCLPQIWDGTATKQPQDDALAVKADKISVEEARCCFETSSASAIHNKVRAFAGWPGTWALLAWGDESNPEARKVKLITTELGKSVPVPNEGAGDHGTVDGGSNRAVVFRDDALELTCGDGSTIRVLEVQPTNKKVMSAKAFVNGLRGMPLSWVPSQ